MYLKEIKTSGFKSFADKINLSLDENITCIVGPNGSGKSNIVDAVKWVLGEQSVKTLRGDGNMTDVIFSGSKSRKQLNLASVTLVFDNTDSYLKVPYSEIAITRKVYRSGENEYYINNEKCRLKDINNLFLDSGIGKYAFNIISQGEVADIINSTPYERRAIIEEAASVLKYKKRKEEALRKLDKTNENMVRVKDIIMELETQIEPLKNQKEQALKYLDYEEKLKNVEIALTAKDLETLNNNYHETQGKIKNLETEIAYKMNKSTNNDAEIEKINTKLLELEKNLTEKNNDYINITTKSETLKGKLNIIKERTKYSSSDTKVHENITNLKEQKLILKNKISLEETILNNMTSNIKRLENDAEQKKEQLQKQEEEKELLENKQKDCQKKVTDLEYKIKYLTDYIDQGAGMNQNVKKILSNPKLEGIHSTIINLIEIEEEYALALSVALSSAKDYVVVSTPEHAKKAINYLKENNLGRVTFFPLNVIKERNIDIETKEKLKNVNGFIDIMSNLLTYEEKYQNIIKNQLGNVLLVDNIDTANKIRTIINGRYKIVTLTGEVINVGGSMTGGKIKTTSVITEKYELEKLTKQKENLTKEIITQKQKLKETENEEQIKKAKYLEIEKERVIEKQKEETKRLEIEDLKEKYNQTSQELESLNNVVNSTLNKEQEEVMNNYYNALSQKENLKQEIEKITKQKEELHAILEEKNATYKLENSHLRKLEQQLKESEIESSKTSIRMDNLLNILSETYQMTFEKAKTNYILEIEEEEARENVKKYKQELKLIGPVNTAAIEEYDRINTRYEFLKKQYFDLEEATVTLLKIIDELDLVMKDEFIKTYKQIEIEFDKVFKELFKGGEAKLSLTKPEDPLNTGININVTPPGKKLSSISLLSGGEKTLAAISLLFAILNIKKIPFCLFDEIEAALDEANVSRVGEYFQKYSGKTQLIIITHKKKTMEYASTLYGITMQESGVSKLVSVKLKEN